MDVSLFQIMGVLIYLSLVVAGLVSAFLLTKILQAVKLI